MPLGLKEVAASRFLDCQHVKVIRLSSLHTGCLYSQEMSLILITITASVDPRAIV